MATRSWHQNFKRASKSNRTDADGTVFDSRGELLRWKKLQLLQLAGEIRGLRRQVAYPLVFHDTLGDPRPILTPTGKTAEYRADFVYERLSELVEPSAGDDGLPRWIEVIEDFKGYQSRENQFRIAVFEAIYGKKVTLTGGKNGGKRWG